MLPRKEVGDCKAPRNMDLITKVRESNREILSLVPKRSINVLDMLVKAF